MKLTRNLEIKEKRERFEYGNTQDDEWSFQLKSPNGRLIFQSDVYTTEEECRQVISAVKQYANSADVLLVESLEQY